MIRRKYGEHSLLSSGLLAGLIGARLRHLSLKLIKNLTDAEASLGLRSGSITALALIEANPGVTQKQIAEVTALDKSAVTLIAEALERQGWIIQQVVKSDRRRRALYVTPKGSEQIAATMALVKAQEEELLAGISKSDLEQLGELIARALSSCMSYEAKISNAATRAPANRNRPRGG